MSHVLLLDAFPSILGEGAHLLGAFRSGAERQGNHLTQFHLSYLKIKDCVRCAACSSPCVIHDEGNAVLHAIEENEVIVFAFPLSTYGFPASIVALLDRLLSVPQEKRQHKKVLFFVVGNPTDAEPLKASCTLLCQKEDWDELTFFVIPSLSQIGEERFLAQCETAFQCGLHLV